MRELKIKCFSFRQLNRDIKLFEQHDTNGELTPDPSLFGKGLSIEFDLTKRGACDLK